MNRTTEHDESSTTIELRPKRKFLSPNPLCRILGLYALCIFTSGEIHAQTKVSGTLVNQTWTSNNSPYLVVGNINVAGLAILPGVTVQFSSNYTFEVDGTLQASGSAAQPIIFTGTNGGWQGIYFNYASPTCTLVECIIANSVNSGIRIETSTPLISSCVISNNSAACSGGGIWSDSPLALNECTIISNNVSCVNSYGAGIYSTAPLILTDCTIAGNAINAYCRVVFKTGNFCSYQNRTPSFLTIGEKDCGFCVFLWRREENGMMA